MAEINSIEELRAAVQRTDALPTISVIAQRLLTLPLNTDEGEREMLNLVESDPLIAARVIGLANSAFFSPMKSICSIREAVMMLGLAKVKAIALSIALLSPIKVRETKFFSVKNLWLHSFSMAIGMRTLSTMLPRSMRPSEDLLFLSGLLHDIGYLAFAYLVPKQFDLFLSKIEENPDQSISELELEILGISHTELGEMLGRNWHLPESVLTVVAGHHDSKKPDHPDDVLLVLARLTELILEDGVIREQRASIESIEPELVALGLDHADLEHVSETLHDQQEQIKVLADMLGN